MPRLITNIARETLEDARLTIRDFTKCDSHGTSHVCVENVSRRAIDAALYKVSRLKLKEKRLAASQVDTPCTWNILPPDFQETIPSDQRLDGEVTVAIDTEIYTLVNR